MTAAIRERPILFSSPMVQAILAGRKTQTRRVVKPQPERYDGKMKWCPPGAKYDPRIDEWVPVATWNADRSPCDTGAAGLTKYCPYGGPGDRLWCRETWSPDHSAFYPNFPLVYRADGCGPDVQGHGELRRVWSDESQAYYPFNWRSPIFMPRWASRITLEITGVGVERLSSITEEDAKAEGIDASEPRQAAWNHRYGFMLLWDRINGKTYPWAYNPFVWKIAFRRVEGGNP